MMRIRINIGKVGLVFRNGDFKRVLKAGAHWVRLNDEVLIYDMKYRFDPQQDLNILLLSEELASMLQVVEVNDNELVLRYDEGRFQEVLTAGKYAYWKGVVEREFVTADLSKAEITENISKTVLQYQEVLKYVRVYVVESFEQGLLFKDGKFVRELESGVHYFWKNAEAIAVLKADLRQLNLEINGQEILTRDKAALRVTFNLKYRVADVQKALVANKDCEKQLYTLSQLALREYIGALTLDEMLSKKDSVSEYVTEHVRSGAEALGVEVLAAGIKDVILPGEMKEIMNQVLIAEKKAQANTIMRREETASTRSLLNTAKLMEENAMLFKLKEMEYVEKIAERINNISISGGDKVVDQMRQLFGA